MSNFLARKIFTLVAVLAAANVYSGTPGQVPEGGMLQDALMHGLMVPDQHLKTFIGKPLLINVWASWCGPCREEIGSVERLSQRSKGRQFNVIGISTDDYDDRALWFVRNSKVTFKNFRDRNLELENMLGAEKLPLTVLVGANGRVLARFYGSRTWDSPAAQEIIDHYFPVAAK